GPGLKPRPPLKPDTRYLRFVLQYAPMANWFTSMNARERRTFAACFSGWALDAMDVQLYAVVMPTLIGLWGLSQTQAGTLGTAALLFSSFCGGVAGLLSDRFRRGNALRCT